MGKLFSCNVDISKNAYLNWQMVPNEVADNLATMARSFSDAAKTLMDIILKDNTDKKADILIFPLMYAINQSIELYLKAILRQIEEIQNQTISIYKTHNINELYQQMVSACKKKESRTKGLEKHLKELKLYIDELFSKIAVANDQHPQMDFARYPIDIDGNEQFYIVLDNNVVIDVENLQNRFKEINESLSSLYSLYQEEAEAHKLHE